MSTPDISTRRAAFRKLHETGCFVIPNPWDLGTARYLAGLGFQAVATTSSGFAFSQGLPDAEWAVSRDAMLGHIAEIVRGSGLPVNADFESGYAHEPERVAENVKLCARTGVAGLSIEDNTGDKHKPLYDIDLAVARIKAARQALDASGRDVLLTARAECYLVDHPEPLKESIRRLERYAEAGADVLYAPGPTTRKDITAIVAAVKPKPVNILMSANVGLKVSDLAAMGVRRVSVGSSLNRAAWGGFVRAAKAIAEKGTFEGFDANEPYGALNDFFRGDLAKRAGA